VLFVTQPLGDKAACGIGLIGKLLVESLVNSTKYEFIAVYTDNNSVLESKILEHNPKFIIYNYHSITTVWLHDTSIRNKYPDIHHIMIHHDMHQQRINEFEPSNYFGFKYVIVGDTTLRAKKNVFLVNRLIPKYERGAYSVNEIPVIGYQGFGQQHKGIYKIAYAVQKEFDEAIIRLHIPFSFYVDPSGIEARKRVSEVRSIITNPKIQIQASHELKSTQELLEFLAGNTINCYFYDYLDGAGLASSPDYALAVNRPLAVTKSHQLRNFLGLNPSICIEDNTLKDIISFGLEPTRVLRERGSEENVITEYENILTEIAWKQQK